jgi:hypothetical protein
MEQFLVQLESYLYTGMLAMATLIATMVWEFKTHEKEGGKI